MTIQELREKMKAKFEKARALHDENRDNWTDEINEQYQALMEEIHTIQATIDRELELSGVEDVATDDPAQAAARAVIEVGHKRVYDTIGEQLVDVVAMTTDSQEAPKARERFQQVVNSTGTIGTGVDGDGGYLVETDHSNEIITTAVETGVLSSRCTRNPIGPNADSLEYYAAKDRDRSAGTLLGGVKTYRKGEKTTMDQFVSAELEPRELKVEDAYALLAVTNRMLRDHVALTGMVKNAIPAAFAFMMDSEIWEGDGVGKCLGITNSDILISVAKESGQTAATINATNLVKMLIRFRGDLSKAAWFVNQDTLGQYPLMTIGDQPIFVPGGSFSNAPYGVLLGRPIIPIEHCETLGTLGDILLGDFSQYLLVEKGGTEEAESIHVRFFTDEKVFRWIKRNNGQPMHDQPITPLKGSNTLSPFVALATRA